MSRPKRRLIATDGKRWYVRRIRTVELRRDAKEELKIYYCDQPLGNDYETLADVPEVKELIEAAVIHAVHTLGAQPADTMHPRPKLK